MLAAELRVAMLRQTAQNINSPSRYFIVKVKPVDIILILFSFMQPFIC